LTVRAEAVTASLSVETPVVSVKGPTQASAVDSIQVSSPVVVRVSSGDPPGTPQAYQGVRVSFDSAAWSLFPGNTTVKYMEVVVYDPAVSVIQRQYFDHISVPSSGRIYGVAGPVAYAVDPNNGATTVLRSGTRNFQEIWASGDGKLYVHYDFSFADDTISRLNGDGSLTPIFGFTGPSHAVMTVREDGTMYVAQGSVLRSRSPEGVVTTLGVGIDPANHGMVYSATDDALYYVTAGASDVSISRN
jgi:hypothetical protein